MKLSYKSGLVTGILEKLRKGLLRKVKHTGSVVIETVGTAVLSCQETGSGGTAEGIGDKGIGESYAVIGNTVKIRSMDMTIVETAHHLGCVVISHDEYDVRPPVGSLT